MIYMQRSDEHAGCHSWHNSRSGLNAGIGLYPSTSRPHGYQMLSCTRWLRQPPLWMSSLTDDMAKVSDLTVSPHAIDKSNYDESQ